MTAVNLVSPYKRQDAGTLAAIYNRAFPAKKLGALLFSHHLEAIDGNDGRIWTIRENRTLVGYGQISPVPGLEGVFDLQGCIDPDRQRHGFGRMLLDQIIRDLGGNGRFELSHAVPSLDTPAARFLTSQGFIVEHTERRLRLQNPESLPAVPLPPDFRIVTYEQETAVRHFRAAYDAIFQGLPWYQPYTEDWEVVIELPNSADLLFLAHEEVIAGFAWLRRNGPGQAEIEPFGIMPAFQGQQLGYRFLAAAIHTLVRKGVNQVQIGAWQNNERAINLYKKIGFKAASKQIYLAYSSEAD